MLARGCNLPVYVREGTRCTVASPFTNGAGLIQVIGMTRVQHPHRIVSTVTLLPTAQEPASNRLSVPFQNK